MCFNDNVMNKNQVPTPPHKFERYGALEGLRAYCAIGIVLMHVLGNISVKPSCNYLTDSVIPWFTDFTLMFMVVSGFSLCCGYYDKIKSGAITPNVFYKKRYMKILPFFACLCLLDFVLSPSLDQLYNLFANLTLCFNFIPNAQIQMIGVGWFLGLVFAFYLLFPFFVFMLDNKRRGWFSLLIALILAGLSTFYSFNCDIAVPDVGRRNIIYSMPLFMAGGMIYLYRDKLKAEGIKQSLVLALCILLTVIFFAFPQLRSSRFYLLVSEMVLFGSWLIYALGSKDFILNNRIVRFLSGISMEIYLCHMVVFRIIEKAYIERFITDCDTLYILTCILVIIGAVAISWGFKKVESFLLSKIKK